MNNNNAENMRIGEHSNDIICDDVKAKPQRSIKALNIQELLDYKFPPREYIINPIIPCQGLAMIYAGRGIGKTHIALNLAFIAASTGSMFDRWTAAKPKRVLYIDGEMPGISIQERLKQITESSPNVEFDPYNLIVLTNDIQEFGLPDISTLKGQAELKEFTDRADLIILDNISTLCRAGAENKSDDWMVVQQWALQMRAQQRSVLFIHHAGKGGAQRGTSKREDVLDTVIALKRPIDYEPNQGARFEVHFEKTRGITGDDASPFIVQLSTEHGQYSWSVQTLEQSTYEKVVQLSNEGLTQTEIAKDLERHKSSISKYLKRAKEDGRINDK